MNLILWIDLLKARKGEHVGGAYIHRWWNHSQGRWSYKYSDKPAAKNGIAHTGSRELHSVKTHPKAQGEAKRAFDQTRDRALKEGGEHTAIYKTPDGRPQFKVKVSGRKQKPIEVHKPRSDKARDAKRKNTFQELENWIAREETTRTVKDAFKRPWFEVRMRAGEGATPRPMVRYFTSSPYNPYPDEEPQWVPGPVIDVVKLREWVKGQHAHQKTQSGKPSPPRKSWPADKYRPLTMAMERGEIEWTSKQVPRKGKRGKVWQRTAILGKRKKEIMGRAFEEHFGLIVNKAQRALSIYGVYSRSNMERILGFTKTPGDEISVNPLSPAYRAVERAVNSYDPSKGWRFSTYFGECMWWEAFKETSKIINALVTHQKMRTAGLPSKVESVKDAPGEDIFETLDVDRDAVPGHEDIIGSGIHYQQPEEVLIPKQELTEDWKKRQEDKLAQYMAKDPMNAERQATAFTARAKLQKVENLEQARAAVVEWQSEGGHQFAEPITREEEPEVPRKKRRVTKDKDWVRFLKRTDLLSPAQRAAFLAVAPDGNLINMRPFPDVAEELHKKHPKEFPEVPTVGRLVELFLSAHQMLSSRPEFQKMERQLSAIEKAIDLLRDLRVQRMDQALDILHKAKKGARVQGHAYLRREGHPGSWKYVYKEKSTGNYVGMTNAPKGHKHHEPEMGAPQLHSDEPDSRTNPEFFDQKGRKMNRGVPEHAEWNKDYDPATARQLWAARWPNENMPGDNSHAYYDEDEKDRDDLKFHVFNKHFDAQLPKIRKLCKDLMQSKQLPNQALGLMIAMADQAYMRAGKKEHEVKRGTLGLCSIKVENVKLKGNMAIFDYGGKRAQRQIHHVVLDPKSLSILKELKRTRGQSKKKKTDYLFSVPVKKGRRLRYQEVGYNKFYRILRHVMGVTPKQFRTYHGTEIYSKTFQQMVKRVKGRLTPEILMGIKEKAALKVGVALGHYSGSGAERKATSSTALRSYIDKEVVKTLFMNAMHPETMGKAFKLQGRTTFQGMPVSIENRKGSVRKWYDKHNEESGRTKMHFAYGYIRGTRGTDGDHVDAYLGPNPNATTAFVVHQMKAPDFEKYDEDKVMLGFDDQKSAEAAYRGQYNKPGFLGNVTPIPMVDFKEKVLDKKNRGKMIKAHGMEEEEEDNGPHVVHLSSSPPPRTPDEEHFSQWLHNHPTHESAHEWEGAKMMGFGEEKPNEHEEEEEDVDHAEDTEPDRDRSAGTQASEEPRRRESPGPDRERAPEQKPTPEKKPTDFSYLDDWGGGSGV